jgi:S1-C subfamily serine protease
MAGALMLVAVAVLESSAGIFDTLAGSAARAQTVAPPPPPNPAVQVYQQNGASVVNITSLAVLPTPGGLAQPPHGIGSGFVVDDQGRIVTNNHVVQDADQLAVTLQDKTTVPARLLGRDPDNGLGVIQVDPSGTDDQGNPISSSRKPVILGDSDQVTIGETAVAIGSPVRPPADGNRGHCERPSEPGR